MADTVHQSRQSPAWSPPRVAQRCFQYVVGALSATPATTALVLGLITVWVIEIAALGPMHGKRPDELMSFGALPDARLRSGAGPGDWWRYVASALLHDTAHPWQLLWNVAALATIGSLVERIYGPLVFVASLVITATAAGLFWVSAASLGVAAIPAYAFGASGAICGVGGAVLAVGVGRRADVSPQLRRRVVIQAAPVVVGTALAGLVLANVNNVAHIGGLIFGGFLGLLLPARAEVGGRGLLRIERVALSGVVAAGVIAVVIAGTHAASGVLST